MVCVCTGRTAMVETCPVGLTSRIALAPASATAQLPVAEAGHRVGMGVLDAGVGRAAAGHDVEPRPAGGTVGTGLQSVLDVAVGVGLLLVNHEVGDDIRLAGLR